jgi:hypothetical protein
MKRSRRIGARPVPGRGLTGEAEFGTQRALALDGDRELAGESATSSVSRFGALALQPADLQGEAAGPCRRSNQLRRGAGKATIGGVRTVARLGSPIGRQGDLPGVLPLIPF